MPQEERQLARKELEELGYIFSQSPMQGLALEKAPDILIPDEIKARLPDNLFTKKLLIFRETSSTNDIAHREAKHGAESGLTVVSERQTSGRGRHGRSWESAEPHGLYLSVVLREDAADISPTYLTIIASLAVCRALEDVAGIPCDIKWPNDIIIEGRKIAGILSETTQDGGSPSKFCVIGIGINVNTTPENLSLPVRDHATSISQLTQLKVRRADVLTSFLRELDEVIRLPSEISLVSWRERCLTLGQPVTVRSGHRVIDGTMVDIDPNGTLLVRLSTGHIETIASGEIIL